MYTVDAGTYLKEKGLTIREIAIRPGLAFSEHKLLPEKTNARRWFMREKRSVVKRELESGLERDEAILLAGSTEKTSRVAVHNGDLKIIDIPLHDNQRIKNTGIFYNCAYAAAIIGAKDYRPDGRDSGEYEGFRRVCEGVLEKRLGEEGISRVPSLEEYAGKSIPIEDLSFEVAFAISIGTLIPEESQSHNDIIDKAAERVIDELVRKIRESGYHTVIGGTAFTGSLNGRVREGTQELPEYQPKPGELSLVLFDAATACVLVKERRDMEKD